MIVPRRFWCGVVVGCRMRAAWTWRSSAAELRSWRVSWMVMVVVVVVRERGIVAYWMRGEEDQRMR